MRLLVRLYSMVVMLMILITLAGAWLLGTGVGSRWLIDTINQRVPALELAYRSGTLLDGIGLGRLRWISEGVHVDIEQSFLALRWSCLWKGTLCVERLLAEGSDIRITFPDSPQVPEPPDQPKQPLNLSLPLALQLDSIYLPRFRLSLPGQTIRWGSVYLRGQWRRDTITVTELTSAELVVNLLPNNDASPAAVDPIEEPIEDTSSPGRLPSLDLPLTVDLQQARLADSLLVIAGTEQRFSELDLVAQLADNRVQLASLAVTHTLGTLSAEGSLGFQGQWPLQVSLSAALAEEAPLPGQGVSLEVDGSLNQLQVQAELTELIQARLAGQLAPLETALPFQAQLSWRDLQWPLTGSPQVSSATGQADLSGSLDNYRLQLKGDVQVPEQALMGDIALLAQGDLSGLQVESLTLAALDGEAQATGQFSWSPALQWQAEISLTDIDLEPWRPAIPLALAGKLQSDGRFEQGKLKLSLATDDLAGSWQQYPLALQTRLSYDADVGLTVSQLELATGDNRLSARGGWDEQVDIQATLAFPALDQLYPGLDGNIEGVVTASGPIAALRAEWAVTARQLSWQTVTIAASRLEGNLRWSEQPRVDLILSLDNLQSPGATLAQASLEFTGTQPSHRLALKFDGQPVAGQLVLNGQMTEQRWQADVEPVLLDTPLARWTSDRFDLVWSLTDSEGTLDAHCWQSGEARLCLKQSLPLAPQGQGQVQLESLDLARLSPWLPPDLQWQGQLQSSAEFAWAPDVPLSLQLQAESTRGQWQLNEELLAQQEVLDLTYERLALDLKLDAAGLQSQLSLQTQQLGQTDLSIQLTGEGDDRQVAGRLRLQAFSLKPAQAFLVPGSLLEGQINADIGFRGALASPLLDGDLQLSGFRYESAQLPLVFEQGEVTMRLSGQQADIQGSYLLQEGLSKLEGSINWQSGRPLGEIRLVGTEQNISYPPLADLTLNADLQITLREELAELNGVINIPRGEITLAGLPEGATPYSDDIVLIEELEQSETSEQQAAPPFALRVTLALGKDVNLSGFGISGKLAGQMDISMLPDRPMESFGSLRLESGRYERFGQQLEIRRSRLFFAGPVSDPRIEIEAIRDLTERHDVIVGLRLTGRLEDPEVNLFSDPSLPDAEILSYLTTGQPLGQSGAETDGMMASAVLALGVMGGQRALDRVTEELGIERVTLETRGEGEQTKVAVGTYVLPDLQIIYGMGVYEPVSELILRYYLGRSFFIEGVSSLNNSLDIYYSITF